MSSKFGQMRPLVSMAIGLSPYLTGMRRVRDGFANRFAKPSRTVAKLSRNVRMVSESPRMHRELVANGSPKF